MRGLLARETSDTPNDNRDRQALRALLASLEERVRNGLLGKGVGAGISNGDGEEVTFSVATLSR